MTISLHRGLINGFSATLLTISLNVAFAEPALNTPQPSSSPQNVVLLLHGMNSSPDTWNDVVSQYFADANCPTIYAGKISAAAQANAQGSYCYRVKFGAFDAASTNKGLEDAWTYGENNGYASAGDYTSFDKLGIEVNKAIASIKKKLPTAQILLIGHSRGGLAARVFLQNPLFDPSNVVGLVTTGTPHNGTRLGRVYKYIRQFLLNPDHSRITTGNFASDWKAIDFLNGNLSCFGQQNFSIDARRPVIGYLADNSPMIKALNANAPNLPAIKYGELVYQGVYLGKLAENFFFVYNLFDEPDVFDICNQVSKQAEAFIKGGTAANPTPSTKYPGDGIVTATSQGAAIFPAVLKQTYKLGVLHADEPKQTAHIAELSCKLGYSWLQSCAPGAQAQSSKTPAPSKAITHDYAQLAALNSQSLWQRWRNLVLDDTQVNQREQLAVALGLVLRGHEDRLFYTDIGQRLPDNNTGQLEPARMAGLLAEIATPSALALLTNTLLNPKASAIQTAVGNAINSLASSMPEQPRRSGLSAILETAWATPKLSPNQVNVLASALAKLGTANGVGVLLASVEQSNLNLASRKPHLLTSGQLKALAAYNAMGQIINPESKTVLEAAFTTPHISELAFIAAGNGLVNLGLEDAAQTVLQRLNDLSADATPIGQHWLNKLSGKLQKTALQRINSLVGMPQNPRLKQQLQEILQ